MNVKPDANGRFVKFKVYITSELARAVRLTACEFDNLPPCKVLGKHIACVWQSAFPQLRESRLW